MTETANYRVNIERDGFSKLLSLLKLFEIECTDCDIKNGIFRCRNNDRYAIISMDLSSIVGENDLSFSLMKNKIGLLKTFELDDNIQVEDKNIWIESNESNYEFNDPFSRMIFRKPVQKYIDNKFISQEEFNTIIKCKEEDLLFIYDINSYMKKRIRSIAEGFGNENIDCLMNEFEAQLKISSKQGDSSIIATGIQMNKQLTARMFHMVPLAFAVDIISDVRFSCYLLSSDVSLCKFEMSFYGIPISIYTQAKIIAQSA
jgi:hypothetical protein